jgi:hypothetical protein
MLGPEDVRKGARVAEAPEIGIGEVGSFPWGVFHRRHPVLVERVSDAHPYGPAQRAALAALLAESTTDAPVGPLPPADPEIAAWREWERGHTGRPWSRAPFLWAESYFYRRLLHAVDHFTPGPWCGLDPFAPTKSAELAAAGSTDLLAQLDALPPDPAGRTRALLLAALWGNRADLSFALGGTGADTAEDELLVDDLDAALERLTGGTVHLVADNAGRELLADLALLDHLLDSGAADQVRLHVKPAPYYVSDATTADVSACLHRMSGAGGRAGEAAARLGRAFAGDRARIGTDPFWCGPLTVDRSPSALLGSFAGATLVIAKGDLNYRRLVGDRRYPETTPFAGLTGYLPAPLLALRTCKSEVVVGLPPGTAGSLDATEPDWRINGAHGVAQYRG